MDNTFDRKTSDKKTIIALISGVIGVSAIAVLIVFAFFKHVSYIMPPEEIAELIDTSECHKIKTLDLIQRNGQIMRINADRIEEQCSREASGAQLLERVDKARR